MLISKLENIRALVSLVLVCALLTMICPVSALAMPVLSSLPSLLTESNLDGATLNLVLTAADGDFSVVTASTAAFALHNAPATTIISSATINTVSSATLVLDYDGTVFSNDIDNFSVTIDHSLLVTGATLTSSTISIQSDHAPPELHISSASPLQEPTLDGSTISLALEHAQFKDTTLSRSNFTFNNAPPGVSVAGVVFSTVTSASLIIDYDGTDFYNDYNNFTVTIAASEMLGGAAVTSNTLGIAADSSADNANLSALMIDGTSVASFSASTTAYNHILAAGASTIPVVSATTQDPNASAAISQATSINGLQAERTATVTVTAQDGLTQKTYTVTYSRSPALISTIPANAETNVNENAVYSRAINGQTYYFLQAIFSDPDGSLQASGAFIDLLRSSIVYADGGSRYSLIDRDLLSYVSSLEDPQAFIAQYLFVSGSGTKTLYIPIRKLGSNVKYIAELNPGLVEYPDGASSQAATWYFTTMSVPSLSTVSMGSVAEEYDESEPIILNGSNFNDNISVYFNETAAYKVKVKTSSSGQKYLEVFLPRGSRHLEPGIYTIKIKNGTDHEATILGSFCVVAASDVPAPAHGERVIDEDSLGTLVEKTANSESILELASSLCSSYDLDIDLDALMGSEVLTRTIEFPANGRVQISYLKTYSKWANVALYGLTSNTSGTGSKARITLGRIPYNQAASLRSRLSQYTIKSDFFEIGGQLYRVNSAEIHLPYRLSDGSRLKLLRYDTASRNFKEMSATVDTSSGIIIAGNVQPGIFVAVE